MGVLDRTPLHWAAANGNMEVVEKLIEGGSDLEAKDKYGMRPALWAAWYGHLEILQLLINSGATSRCSNKQGMGLLHCASQNNNINVMNFIFESLENINVNEVDKCDRTSLHLAAENGHLEAVMRLIDMRCDCARRDKSGETALHLAARNNHYEVIKKLLMLGVEINDRDVEGRTALHIAAQNGRPEAVEQGNSALHLATLGNHTELTRLLVDAKCQIDLTNYLGKTPLQLASRGSFIAIVDMIVKAERYYAVARVG
ncbi:hypothetical protein KUTeg_017697 [Tegillarca granosa]|uniref:Uncharacterized protein n=1 Tax=Tegillarca granosa TaxID=220873 RepID=A0ABQ9EFN7_TEGGR|nr:hypothetical protein KUTeg_017697 [Tegillarca granosa]